VFDVVNFEQIELQNEYTKEQLLEYLSTADTGPSTSKTFSYFTDTRIGITDGIGENEGVFSLKENVITFSYKDGITEEAVYIPFSQEIEYHTHDIFGTLIYEYFAKTEGAETTLGEISQIDLKTPAFKIYRGVAIGSSAEELTSIYEL
jgi:hypothetical protein